MVNQQAVSFISPSNELSYTFLSKKFDLQDHQDFLHYISKQTSKGEFISANDVSEKDSSLCFNDIDGLQNAGKDARSSEDNPRPAHYKEDVMNYLGLKPSRGLQDNTSLGQAPVSQVTFATKRRNCTVPISSPLGTLWLKNTTRGKLKYPERKLKHVEKYCQSSPHLPKSRFHGVVSSVKDLPSCASSGSSSSLVQWSHTYCFSKQQRKEKETHLSCLPKGNTEHRLNSCVKLEKLKELSNPPKLKTEHRLQMCYVRLEKLKIPRSLPEVNTEHRVKTCSVVLEKLNLSNSKTLDLLKICRPLRVSIDTLQVSDADAYRQLQVCRPCKVVIRRLN